MAELTLFSVRNDLSQNKQIYNEYIKECYVRGVQKEILIILRISSKMTDTFLFIKKFRLQNSVVIFDIFILRHHIEKKFYEFEIRTKIV